MLQWEHSEILLTFIKLHVSFVIKIFVLSIFEWPLKTGFTVYADVGLALGTVYENFSHMGTNSGNHDVQEINFL